MKVITLPNGHPVTIAEYVRSWRILLTIPPDRSVARWSHFPVSAGQILADIRHGIHDRINRHLPWLVHECHQRHARRKLAKLVRIGLLKCECRWCGSPLTDYQPHENRFCESSCRRSYYH